MSMTLLKKKVKQVSLDFKKLSADVVSRIEVLDKEASLQHESDCRDDDCQIISKDNESDAELSNQKIDRFFSSMNSKPKEFRSCGVTLDKCDAKITLTSDSDSGTDENEVQDLSSSEESEKEEDTENLQSVNGETKPQSGETKDTKKASNESSKEKSDNDVKKRRTSAQVQTDRKRKELDKARRRIEREAAKLKRMEELAKVKEEKRKEKEKAAAEREALKQQVEKEKEDRRVKREEAKRERDRVKEEERLKKEDEKQKKEEERRKREEEKQEKIEKLEQARKEKEEAKKQEAEAKKQEAVVLQRKVEKQAMLFNSFFIKDKAKPPADENQKKQIVKPSDNGRFGIFHVKKGMRMAPRRQSIVLSAKVADALDDFLCDKKSNLEQDLYLSELRNGRRKGMTLEATWPLEKTPGEVQCLGTSFEASKADKEWYRAKLLQFCENTRPSFYGTFRQRSRVISGRTPFQKDSRLFDYDIDSDDEWEEDPGESLSHSENEDEDEEDADEENDGFFVPHGYLSEDEEADDDEDRMTPEMRKLKQRMSEERFEASRKKNIQTLFNVVVPPSVDPKEHPLLSSFKIIVLTDNFPISMSAVVQSSSANKVASKNGVPDEAMPDIVRLIHGNKLRLKKLIFEFRMFWEHKLSDRIPAVTYEEDLKGRDWKEFSISKTQLEKRIREIAKFEDGSWRVGAETRAVYPADDVNNWEYITNVLEITRKKRPSSPLKTVPQNSPDKDVDKQKQTDQQPKTKSNSSVEAKNETKTPIKPLKKAKLREEESKAADTSPKTPSSKSPSTPTNEGGTLEEKNAKMSPKSAKKTAQREAMQKLKAELLKETTKVFTGTPTVKKPQNGSGDGKLDTTVPTNAKVGKSSKAAVKKRPNISVSAPKRQKQTCPSSEVVSKEGKQKVAPPKKARKSEQNSTAETGTKPKPKPKAKQDPSKPVPPNKPKPNGRKKSISKQESKGGDVKPNTNKSSELKESDSSKEIATIVIADSNSQPDPKLDSGNFMSKTTDHSSSVNLSERGSDQSATVKVNDASKVIEPLTLAGNSRTKEQTISISNDADKSELSTKPVKSCTNTGANVVSKPCKKFSVNLFATSVTDTSESKRANPEPLKETQPKVGKSSTGKKKEENKKMGEVQKSTKKVQMNGRPLKRISDTSALTKVPARKARFYDKNSEDEVEIIDLIDS